MNITTTQGLVHYYYGDGKGKTSAALGMAVRHLGYGRSVFIVQFLKNRPCGEVSFLATQPLVTLLRGKVGDGLPSRLSDIERQETRTLQDANLRQAILAAPTTSLLVLDEVSDAVRLELVCAKNLFHFLQNKPEHIEIVMTGHRPQQEFCAIADYVSEVRKEKHPFDRGITAREGIEY